MIDYSYQLIYRRINDRFQTATIARHEAWLMRAIESRVRIQRASRLTPWPLQRS